MEASAFATPSWCWTERRARSVLPLTRCLIVVPLPRPCKRCHAPSTRLSIRGQGSAEAPPNFKAGWVPEKDRNYCETRVLTIGPTDRTSGGSILTLAPVKLSKKALKMSMTSAQIESIKAALQGLSQKGGRPSTQDLFKSIVLANNGVLCKAAITHIHNEIYYGRIWVRTGYRTVNIDSRPSDAIALATRCQAPIYLNKHLLSKWGVPMQTVANELAHGITTLAKYDVRAKTSTMIVAELARRPEEMHIARLKSRLDLAKRLGRRSEVDDILKELRAANPVAHLMTEYAKAIEDERYMDAKELDEKIIRCRVQMWLARKSSSEDFTFLEDEADDNESDQDGNAEHDVDKIFTT